MSDQDKLVAFLYLLGRDELPIGKVEKLVAAAEETNRKKERVEYSEPNLLGWACSIADRLDEGE